MREIETFAADIPFQERSGTYSQPQWGVSFRSVWPFCKVTLTNGVVGAGEGRTNMDRLGDAIGQPADELLWQNSWGRGLEMALFDAVARSREVPVHALLGEQQRRRVPVCWSAFAMPPEEWARECREAIAAGYRAFKGVARPWFDLTAQAEAVMNEAVDGFRVSFDFNGWLPGAARAESLLQELERRWEFQSFEEPILCVDSQGYQRLARNLQTPVVLHSAYPELGRSLDLGLCDGFVLSGSARQLRESGDRLARANKPFLLQVRGSDLQAAFCLHFASVLSHATLPSVTLHHLFAERTIDRPIEVRDGEALVPEGPGLGVEPDWETLERYRLRDHACPQDAGRRRLLRVRWGNGAISYYTDAADCADEILRRPDLGFQPGVRMEEIPDDGGGYWSQLFDCASREPLRLRAWAS